MEQTTGTGEAGERAGEAWSPNEQGGECDGEERDLEVPTGHFEQQGFLHGKNPTQTGAEGSGRHPKKS